MAFLTTTANAVLNKVLRNTDFTQPATLQLGLHTADPGTTGSNEVSGGSYARQTISFDAASSKVCASSSQINFTTMPETTVSFVAIYGSTGTMWWGGAMSVNKATGAGDTLQFAAGGITVTLT